MDRMDRIPGIERMKPAAGAGRGWSWRRLLAPLCGLAVFGLTSAPRAEGLDMDTLEDMLEEERVRVEAVLGRQLLETPTLRTATFEEFVSSAMVAARLRDPRLAADPNALAAKERALREDHTKTIAVYSNYDGAITLLTDRLQVTVKELGDESTRAALRCVMDHELTHAIQDQWVNDDLTGRLSDGDRSLGVEGQATWVTAQLCDDPAAREALLDGLSVLAPGSRTAESYSLGWWLMEGLVSRWGVEATWAALDAPPSRAETRALLRAHAAPEAPSFKRHVKVIEAAYPAAPQSWKISSATNITDLTLWWAMRGPDVQPPRGDQARVTVAQFETMPQQTPRAPSRIGVTTVGWYHVRDEAEAARWLERRCAALLGAREGLVALDSMTPLAGLPIDEQARLAPAAFVDLVALAPKAKARCGVAGTLTGVNYVELWALQDNVLLLIAQTYSGAAIAEPEPLVSAIGGYVRKNKGGDIDEESLGLGLSALVPTPTGAAATPSWTRYLTRAHHELYRGRWSACLSHAQALLRVMPEAEREQGVWPAYYCGVMSGDDELYRAAVEMIGEDEDLGAWAGGIDRFLRERGELERAAQFMSRHCVEVADDDPRCAL